jgi:excisionase family DNA binding protein
VQDYYNISEAAKLLGVSIPTIRAKIKRKELPNAQKPKGTRSTWLIPLSDLMATKEMNKVEAKPEEKAEARANALELEIDRLRAEIEHLRELVEIYKAQSQDYRAIFYSIETKAKQEKRRSLWARITGKP